MIRLRHKLFVHAMRVADPALLVGTLAGILALTGGHGIRGVFDEILSPAYRPRNALAALTLVMGWVWVFDRLVRYDTDRFTPLSSDLADAAKAAALSALLLLVVAAAFTLTRVNKEVIFLVCVTSNFLLMASRVLAHGFLKAVRRSGYNCRYALLVGTGPRAVRIAARINQLPELGYKIVGFVAQPGVTAQDGIPDLGPVLGDVGEVCKILEERTIDEMLICMPLHGNFSAIVEMVNLAQELGIVARVFPDDGGRNILTRLRLERFEGQFVVTLFREQHLLQLLGKRLMDIGLSLAVLVLTSPLLLATALAIKLTSPGPVLFVQARVGMNKRTFDLYKFRSMYVGAEKRRQELSQLNEMDGPVFKIRNDPRVTPVGHFIRRTSIDELPQLFNVLKGEMSLVGPRPPLRDEVDQYQWLYRRRLSLKPGITCLWQISGRNKVSFSQWMELDQRYIDNWSLWLDVKILLKTIPAVLSLRGAS
jgi:exopolysaccharide biosynthesis polyprenyl glycosylphosphotransferase